MKILMTTCLKNPEVFTNGIKIRDQISKIQGFWKYPGPTMKIGVFFWASGKSGTSRHPVMVNVYHS